MKGELVLRIDESCDSSGVVIKTFYDKLIPRVDDEEFKDDLVDGTVKMCTLKMDSKKLSSSLQWQQNMIKGAVNSYIVCMIQNEMMVVHVMLNPEELGFFTYYIPVYYLGGDELG